MLRKLRTTCAEERHVLIHSWELSMRPAPVNTLWKRLVNCTPKISAVLGPWFPWSLLRAVRCEGGKGWPVLVLSPTQPVGAGSPRAQPLAAQILQHQQTSSQGDCFFIKLFNSSNFLVYKINTSGYTRYVTFYDDTSSTTIRCFYWVKPYFRNFFLIHSKHAVLRAEAYSGSRDTGPALRSPLSPPGPGDLSRSCTACHVPALRVVLSCLSFMFSP